MSAVGENGRNLNLGHQMVSGMTLFHELQIAQLLELECHYIIVGGAQEFEMSKFTPKFGIPLSAIYSISPPPSFSMRFKGLHVELIGRKN